MLRKFILAVVGGLLAAGCAANGGGNGDALPTEPESAKNAPSKSSGDNGDLDDGHYTLPATPSDPASDPGSTPTTPADPPTDPPGPPADPGAPPPAGSQTSMCTALNGGHKSITSIIFTLDNGTLKIVKMTVDMTNKDSRNKNDVDVYVTPSGGAEKKSFNSGDILPNGKITNVPLPGTFAVNAGAKVRILTHFDESFSDPSASCIIQF